MQIVSFFFSLSLLIKVVARPLNAREQTRIKRSAGSELDSLALQIEITILSTCHFIFLALAMQLSEAKVAQVLRQNTSQTQTQNFLLVVVVVK